MNQDNKGDGNRIAGRDYINNYNFNLNAEKVEKLPSILGSVFQSICGIILEYDAVHDLKEYKIPFEIEEKINYNNIKKYKCILREYGSYIVLVDSFLDELDNIKPGKKRRFLQKINLLYLDTIYKLKKDGESNISFIKKENNSDLIIDEIKDFILSKCDIVDESKKISEEDLEVSIIVILCKALIECKILENPKI